MSRLEVTILGSGSSAGVPRGDGEWGVCDPTEPKNRRSRCSMMARRIGEGGPEAWTTVVIDTSPEFRLQTSEAGARRLDAVLFTHDHADQTHGIDDVRGFVIRQRARIPMHMDGATHASLMRRFGYIFEGEGGYPAICDAHLIAPHGTPWKVSGPSGDIPITTFDQDHGGVRSVGYRLGNMAYSSDVVELDEAAFAALKGVEVWILDALRWTPHPTHSHVEKSLAWIERVRPKRAILTNLHFDIDYADLGSKLPPGVEAGFDQMRFEIDIA